jgi:hypothetical protein
VSTRYAIALYSGDTLKGYHFHAVDHLLPASTVMKKLQAYAYASKQVAVANRDALQKKPGERWVVMPITTPVESASRQHIDQLFEGEKRWDYVFDVDTGSGVVHVKMGAWNTGFFGEIEGTFKGKPIKGEVEYGNGGLLSVLVPGLSDEDDEELQDLVDAAPTVNDISAAYYRQFESRYATKSTLPTQAEAAQPGEVRIARRYFSGCYSATWFLDDQQVTAGLGILTVEFDDSVSKYDAANTVHLGLADAGFTQDGVPDALLTYDVSEDDGVISVQVYARKIEVQGLPH